MCQKSLTFFPHSTRIGQHLMQNSVAAAGLLPPPSPLFRFSIAGSPPFPFSTCQEPSALFSSRFCLPLCLLFHRDSSVLYTGSTHVSKNIFFCHVFKKVVLMFLLWQNLGCSSEFFFFSWEQIKLWIYGLKRLLKGVSLWNIVKYYCRRFEHTLCLFPRLVSESLIHLIHFSDRGGRPRIPSK